MIGNLTNTDGWHVRCIMPNEHYHGLFTSLTNNIVTLPLHPTDLEYAEAKEISGEFTERKTVYFDIAVEKKW